MTTPASSAPKRDVHGIVLLDKPLGVSSNRALQIAKRIFRAKKAGHTGSLDPQATGMLPICFGDATRLSQLLLDADKRYTVTASLGARSSTGDREGEKLEHAAIPLLDRAGWQAIADTFVGDIMQIPPMYSALKHSGKRLYELARAGQEVARPPRPVTIHALEVVAIDAQGLHLDVTCSKGTYIRTLVEDIAVAAGTLAWTAALRRVAVAPFGQSMTTIDALEAEQGDLHALDSLLLAADEAIPGWPTVSLDSEMARRFCLGQRLPVEGLLSADYRCYGPGGLFLGTGSSETDGVLRPRRVMTGAQSSVLGK